MCAGEPRELLRAADPHSLRVREAPQGGGVGGDLHRGQDHWYPTPAHLLPTGIHIYRVVDRGQDLWNPTPAHLLPTGRYVYWVIYRGQDHWNPTPAHLLPTGRYIG